MRKPNSLYTKTLAILGLALMGLTSGASAEESKDVQLAADRWPPFTNHFSKPRLATELVHLALVRSGYNPSTKILDHWTVPEDLKAGKYDGNEAMWKTPEREEYLLFSKPYLESRLYLVGQKGNDVSATDLSELKGKRLAIVKGYGYGKLLDSIEGVEIIYGQTDVENLKMLTRDEADYTLTDGLLIQYALKEQPEKCAEFVTFGTTELAVNPLHFVLRKDLPGAAEMMKKFNQNIRLMQADGTYNRVLRLNSISIDLDGDGQKELVLADINLEIGAPTGGYEIYSNDKKLPAKTRYSIRDTIYNGWDEVPDDYRSIDDVIPDTRKEGFNLFGGDF